MCSKLVGVASVYIDNLCFKTSCMPVLRLVHYVILFVFFLCSFLAKVTLLLKYVRIWNLVYV